MIALVSEIEIPSRWFGRRVCICLFEVGASVPFRNIDASVDIAR